MIYGPTTTACTPNHLIPQEKKTYAPTHKSQFYNQWTVNFEILLKRVINLRRGLRK
jgi:hypothetical protein